MGRLGLLRQLLSRRPARLPRARYHRLQFHLAQFRLAQLLPAQLLLAQLRLAQFQLARHRQPRSHRARSRPARSRLARFSQVQPRLARFRQVRFHRIPVHHRLPELSLPPRYLGLVLTRLRPLPKLVRTLLMVKLAPLQLLLLRLLAVRLSQARSQARLHPIPVPQVYLVLSPPLQFPGQARIQRLQQPRRVFIRAMVKRVLPQRLLSRHPVAVLLLRALFSRAPPRLQFRELSLPRQCRGLVHSPQPRRPRLGPTPATARLVPRQR